MLQIPVAHALPPETLNQARQHIQAQLDTSLAPGERLEIRFAPSHTHLDLAPCGQALQFESTRPLDAGRFSLKVSCDYPKHWSLRLNGEIARYARVLVSARPLPRGARLTRADWFTEERDVSTLRRGYYRAGEALSDYETTRALRRGQVLTPRDVSPPLMVLKGDRVTITAGNGGLEIRVAGEALEDGRQHQQIRVRNRESGKVIRARILGPGLVKAGH